MNIKKTNPAKFCFSMSVLFALSACEESDLRSPRIELDSPTYLSAITEKPRLYGIVRNLEDYGAVFVRANCSFYDAASALVAVERGYVNGTNVSLPSIGATTNTALYPDETGIFEIWLDIDVDEFATYECEFSSLTMDDAHEPQANLELVGEVTIHESYFGNVEYHGQLKNTGTMKLIRGGLYIVTRDTADSIINMTLGYVSGEPQTLPNGYTTNDALAVGSIGSFEVNTLHVPTASYGRHSILMTWDDYDGVEWGADMGKSSIANDDSHGYVEKRLQTIDALRKEYLSVQ